MATHLRGYCHPYGFCDYDDVVEWRRRRKEDALVACLAKLPIEQYRHDVDHPLDLFSWVLQDLIDVPDDNEPRPNMSHSKQQRHHGEAARHILRGQSRKHFFLPVASGHDSLGPHIILAWIWVKSIHLDFPHWATKYDGLPLIHLLNTITPCQH